MRRNHTIRIRMKMNIHNNNTIAYGFSALRMLMIEWLNSKSIVATTCLGITHGILKKKKFDYCIGNPLSNVYNILKITLLSPISYLHTS